MSELEYTKKSFCPYCGGALTDVIIEDKPRQRCSVCGRIIYENPIPSTAVAVMRNGRVMVVKRAVEPYIGEWCLPGGFLEITETPEKGALRELYEETGLIGSNPRLLGVRIQKSCRYLSVLLVGYLVDADGEPKPSDDASEIGYFAMDDVGRIPFESHRYFAEMALTIVRDKGNE